MQVTYRTRTGQVIGPASLVREDLRLVERGGTRVRLALPWLRRVLERARAEAATTVRLPATEWLVARGHLRVPRVEDWRLWLLDPVGGGADVLKHWPAGPCIRAAGSHERPRGFWACARPVHLLTAIDHLQLSPESVVLDAPDRDRLLADLNLHFGDRGFWFHEPGNGLDWPVECRMPVACDCVEPDVGVGRNLRDMVPTGPDASRVKALMNEGQMLLHEHPVNEARAARGLPVVNSLWLWGFGNVEDAPLPELPELVTDDPWLAGLWKLSGSLARSLADSDAAGVLEPGATYAWSRPTSGSAQEAIERADATWLRSAQWSLQRGLVDAVEILLGDTVVVADRSSRYRFWRRSRPLQEVLA